MHHVFATDRSNTVFFGAVALTKPFERKRIKATGCLGQHLEQGTYGQYNANQAEVQYEYSSGATLWGRERGGLLTQHMINQSKVSA